MNRTIMELTVRELLGAKRTLLLGLFALIPVLIAILYRTAGKDLAPDHWAANTLYARLIVTTVLPLTALIFGTAAIGSEFEDGTAVYILARPIERWRVVLSKLAVAAAATCILVLLSTLVSGLIATSGQGDAGSIVTGFSIAMVGGSIVYCCIFVCLSIVTSRALIVGLIYVFLWESVITTLFSGLRVFSVRQYVLGLANRIASVDSSIYTARLNGVAAAVLMLVVASLATVYAVRRLQRWEIGEST